MLFGRYQFKCVFLSDAILPPYKGSTFRGVFGRALKQVVCTRHNADCNTCLVKSQCLYVSVFETDLKENLPENTRLAGPPHPFIIEPPNDSTTDHRSGDRFDFNLLLFGNVNHHLAYFIYAFEQMGKIGIGREINGQRGTFKLEKVFIEDRTIYDAQTGLLQSVDPLPRLTVAPVLTPGQETIQIHLRTPLRLKYQNQFNPDLPFHVLVRALLRRISSLLSAYGDGEPVLDYKGLVHRAQAVKTVASDLQWDDWRRYSFRQKKEMMLGGLMGRITYAGDLNEYFPLIQFGEKAHIGKQTTFGLGGYDQESLSQNHFFQA